MKLADPESISLSAEREFEALDSPILFLKQIYLIAQSNCDPIPVLVSYIYDGFLQSPDDRVPYRHRIVLYGLFVVILPHPYVHSENYDNQHDPLQYQQPLNVKRVLPTVALCNLRVYCENAPHAGNTRLQQFAKRRSRS